MAQRAGSEPQAAASTRAISHQTLVVTGCTQGIGKETAEALAGMGATVIMACRNLDAAETVAAEIRRRHPGASIIVGPRLDLADQSSVRRFAAEYRAHRWPLHCLVNNAGTNHRGKPWHTPEGVAGLAQVNYLGPYTLTRLLEEELQRSAPSRVVNLSSVTHRFAGFPAPSTFLTAWAASDDVGGGFGGDYPRTKLANALFAFELQRRLGASGVSSCAVDPGGVASNIWKGTPASRPPLSWLINSLYAPPSDGAAAVVQAATVPWEADLEAAAEVNSRWNRPAVHALHAGGGRGASSGGPRRPAGRDDASKSPPGTDSTTAAGHGGSSSKASGSWKGERHAADDLRFYARGLFASPLVTCTRGIPCGGALDRAREAAWWLSCLLHSAADWPLRRLAGGRWLARTVPVPAAPLCYDSALAAELWDVSADVAGVPRAAKLVAKSRGS